MKQSVGGDFELYELDLESSALTQITDNDTDDVDVSRSKDSKKVVWQKRLADGRQALELRTYDEAGSQTAKTLASASPFVQPSLSSNGRWLAFIQLRPSYFAVMRYDINENKYKEVRKIARRKKLYHPSITDDGNLVGWSERVSQKWYRVKNLTTNVIETVATDDAGIEHAELSADGEHIIYSVNAQNAKETRVTSLSTLETSLIGSVLSGDERYLGTSWDEF